MLDLILAYGPIGGIDAGAAVKWTCIWTAIMGVLLYGSLAFFPSWVELDDDKTAHHH